MCDIGAGEDVENLLVMCGEFERDWWGGMDDMSRIVGIEEWLEEYGSVCTEDMVAWLLWKGLERVSDTVMEEVGVCIVYWIGKWWQRWICCMVSQWMNFGPLPFPHL